MLLLNFIKKNCFLACIALALLILRFIFAQYSSSGPDQSYLQWLVSDYLASGEIPLKGMGGSQGYHYGPFPLWVYLGIRFLFDHSISAAYGHIFFITLGILFFSLAAKEFFGKVSATWVFFFFGCSAFYFFFTRAAWDNTFLFLTVSLSLFSFAKALVSKSHIWTLILGLTLSASLQVHLMSVSFVGITLGTFILRMGARKNFKSILLVSLVLVVTMIPYTLEFLRDLQAGQSSQAYGRVTPFKLAGDHILRSTQLLSNWSFDSYFKVPQSIFSKILFRLDIWGHLLRLCFFYFAIKELFHFARKRKWSFEFFVSLQWFAGWIFLSMTGVPQYFHYHQAISWTPVFLVAAILGKVQTPMSYFLKAIVLLSLVSGTFVLGWMLRISHGNPGFRVQTLGVSFEDHRLLAKEACRMIAQLKFSIPPAPEKATDKSTDKSTVGKIIIDTRDLEFNFDSFFLFAKELSDCPFQNVYVRGNHNYRGERVVSNVAFRPQLSFIQSKNDPIERCHLTVKQIVPAEILACP